MAGVKGRSGDKTKRQKYGPLYRATDKQLHAILPKVADALEDLVVGVLVQELTIEGPRVYQKPPNIEAIKVLLNRTIGPEVRQIEVSGEIEHKLETVYVDAPRPRLLGSG